MEKSSAPMDSSSDQSPSDHEKRIDSKPAAFVDDVNREVPDPDEGLSEEERKKIDRKLLWKLDRTLIPWASDTSNFNTMHFAASLFSGKLGR